MLDCLKQMHHMQINIIAIKLSQVPCTVCYCYDSIMHCQCLANINKLYNCKICYWNIPIRTVGLPPCKIVSESSIIRHYLKKQDVFKMTNISGIGTTYLFDFFWNIHQTLHSEEVVSHRGDARTIFFFFFNTGLFIDRYCNCLVYTK